MLRRAISMLKKGLESKNAEFADLKAKH